MAWIRTLETLDRRWIFLIMGLLVMGPLIFPAGLPLTVSPPAQSFHDAIEALPNGSTVLMSCDYDPGARPELVPMTRTAIRHLMQKNCKVVVTVLWNAGPALVDATLSDVITTEFPNKQYGVDWVNLGYK